MSLRAALGLLVSLGVLGGCATLPPGHDFPRTVSTALQDPGPTRLGHRLDEAAHQHPGQSGFRLLTLGLDGFLVRAQMAEAAEKTLDLQYFILRADETGKLLSGAVLRAADRGVRVRILVDDGETSLGDNQIEALDGHPNIEVRVFNPFAYRGPAKAMRLLEYLVTPRLDYRMHNKLFVADNTLALVGGRNIGDPYFQIDPEGQLGDDDVFAAGPVVKQLSSSFDEFWNSSIAIPSAAFAAGSDPATALAEFRGVLEDHRRDLRDERTDYALRITSGEPLAGIIDGRLPLVWAAARLVYDSPGKKGIDQGIVAGRLINEPVAAEIRAVRSELLMVSPYFIPGDEGMRLFRDLRERGVSVRVLTNSLESTNVLLAHSGYMHYRLPLLESGVELHEVRSLLGDARGSGQSAAMSRFGNYALHGKLFVFDRERLFIGSMNFDQRSMHLNTEIGLIIESPELARQTAARIEFMLQSVNSYALALSPEGQGSRQLLWRTRVGGEALEYAEEPARNAWQRAKARLLSVLPLDREL